MFYMNQTNDDMNGIQLGADHHGTWRLSTFWNIIFISKIPLETFTFSKALLVNSPDAMALFYLAMTANFVKFRLIFAISMQHS